MRPVPVPEQGGEVAQNPAPGAAPGEVGQYAGSGAASLAFLGYTRPGARTALVYLHGIESHAGWFALAAEALRIMEEHEISSLVVVDDTHAVTGVVHLMSLLHAGIA